MKKKNHLKISIITVVFNNVQNIEKTINSVFDQTYKDIEYIIIDGGSTDGTVDIIKKYKKNINYWISEPDKGIYDAMNKGAKKATGDYLYFLNSGDYFYNSKVLFEISKYFTSGYLLVVGCVARLHEDYKAYRKPTKDKLRFGKTLPHQGSFIANSYFKKIGGYDKRYKSSGDFDFFCRFFSENLPYKFVDLNVACMSPVSYSSKNKRLTIKEVSLIIREHFGVFYAVVYYLYNGFVEQGVKKLLLTLRLQCLYERLLKLKTQRRV